MKIAIILLIIGTIIAFDFEEDNDSKDDDRQQPPTQPTETTILPTISDTTTTGASTTTTFDKTFGTTPTTTTTPTYSTIYEEQQTATPSTNRADTTIDRTKSLKICDLDDPILLQKIRKIIQALNEIDLENISQKINIFDHYNTNYYDNESIINIIRWLDRPCRGISDCQKLR